MLTLALLIALSILTGWACRGAYRQWAEPRRRCGQLDLTALSRQKR